MYLYINNSGFIVIAILKKNRSNCLQLVSWNTENKFEEFMLAFVKKMNFNVTV
jgi:hypothetical protein